MKIMGIDYGDARTGVSISDPTGFLAGSPQVISTWNTEKLLDSLEDNDDVQHVWHNWENEDDYEE